MFLDEFLCNIKIVTVLHLSWDRTDADALPRKFHALSYRVRGNAHYTTGTHALDAHTNDILFVPENFGYHIKGIQESLYVIHFEAKDLSYDTLEKFQNLDPTTTQNLFKSCYVVWQKKNSGYYFKCMSYLFQIFSLIKSYSVDEISNPKYALLQPAITYINQNFKDADLSISAICNSINMSDTYFRKLFFGLYQTTPLKYINTLRINYAKELLESGYYTVEQAAVSSGYKDPKHFSTVFKSYVGCPPYVYKQNK